MMTMIIILITILIIFFLIVMILVIVMRPRARLTPHLPVNYRNSLQQSLGNGGRRAPSKKGTKKSNTAQCTGMRGARILEVHGQRVLPSMVSLQATKHIVLQLCLAQFYLVYHAAVASLPTQCKKAGDKSSFCLWSPGSWDPGVERCMLQVSNTLPPNNIVLQHPPPQ